MDNTHKFNADFGRTATDYAKHRAGYPDALFGRLMRRGLARPGMRALDLATGTGYLGRGLAQRGLVVTGLDISADMIAASRALDAANGVAMDYVLGKAEETGLPAGSFDLVTAACCWHWFDRPKAAAEVLRLLKPGGALVLCSQNWLPLPGNVVQKSEAILQRHNPAWPFGGLDGMNPGFIRDLRAAGFLDIEGSSIDFDIPYGRDAWRGRLRASAAVSGSLPADQAAVVDRDLAEMLARDFPQEPLQVAHCLFTAWGRKTR
jgi:SAM-dependent methyltransferase